MQEQLVLLKARLLDAQDAASETQALLQQIAQAAGMKQGDKLTELPKLVAELKTTAGMVPAEEV